MTDETQKKKIAYQAVLASPDGKIMMKDLNRYFGRSTLGKTPEESHALSAKRELLLHIEMMGRSDKDAVVG